MSPGGSPSTMTSGIAWSPGSVNTIVGGRDALMLSPRTSTWLLAILALIMPEWCWLVGVTVLVILPVELRTMIRNRDAGGPVWSAGMAGRSVSQA